MFGRADLLQRVVDVGVDGVHRRVLIVGVSRFARMRAAVGYRLAEDVLLELARRLSGITGETIVARLAPDAIGVCVFQPGSASRAEDMLALVHAALEQPMVLAGHRIDPAVRIGYVDAPVGVEAEDLLHQAEIALDQARENSRSIWRFSPEEYGDPTGRLTLLDELAKALDRGELQLHYQPQINAGTGEVVSVEALMRWESPTRGRVPPGHFIPAAEETGLIRDLTVWSIERAIEDAAHLERAGYQMRIGVNISSRLLCDPGFIARATEMVQDKAHGLTFEITESVAISDWRLALESLKAFSEVGVRIAIDDYGSGAATLAYIQQLPAQELKIDRLFVTHIADSHRDPLLVRSTIELGHALDLEVVAEGVQDADALALLATMGCDIAQGYYIGMPMPLADLFGYLRDETGRKLVAEASPQKMFWR